MKSWCRFVFVFVAYGMAMLHTAVPHHHFDRRAGEAVLTHSGCLFNSSVGGVLQLALSTDLGYGHLETFNKGGDSEFEFPSCHFLLALITATPSFISESQVSFYSYGDSYISYLKKRLLLLSSAHFRAPPDLF